VIGETARNRRRRHDLPRRTLGGVAPSLNSAAHVDHSAIRPYGNGACGSGGRCGADSPWGRCQGLDANAVVVQDVPAGVVVVGIPARRFSQGEGGEFLAYGTPRGDLPDRRRALEAVAEHVGAMHARIDTLESRQLAAGGGGGGAVRAVPCRGRQ